MMISRLTELPLPEKAPPRSHNDLNLSAASPCTEKFDLFGQGHAKGVSPARLPAVPDPPAIAGTVCFDAEFSVGYMANYLSVTEPMI